MKSSTARKAEVPPGYVADPKQPAMLRFQASLPHLPVPTLSSTASKYLETVKPLLSEADYSQTQSAVQKFVDSSLGQELQSRLQARADDKSVTNWLAEWWNEAAYMSYRDPVVVNVSYYYVHVLDRRRKTAAQRASSLVKAMLPFRDLVVQGKLEPEKAKGSPMCMDSYKWLFHSSRYPATPSDAARTYDYQKHNHVVFVRKNKFYKVSLATPEGSELSAAELEVQIEKVISMAGESKGVPVGALTSDNRDNWFDNRNILAKANPANEKTFEAIESAAIIVCLDDVKPVTREDVAWNMWVGDGRNRFYDKHQLIVCDNGVSGFLGEHSCMDGTTTLRMNEFMLASLAANKIDLGSKRDADTGSDLPSPIELKFHLDSESLEAIKAAERRFDELVGKHDLHVLHYEGYGKGAIKKFKVSPDGWAQAVKQLAFYKMFGKLAVTYESAQTRKFQLGRTEVIRSASNEMKAWVLAMENPESSDSERSSLFRAVISRHAQYSAWAADGQGVDRHLFGLKKVLRDGEAAPAIYSDKAFALSSHWQLSTSQLSSPFLDGWGYGEVVPDGYGLSYSIAENAIRWTVTSLKRDSSTLKHYLAEAATETIQMMQNAAASETKAKL